MPRGGGDRSFRSIGGGFRGTNIGGFRGGGIRGGPTGFRMGTPHPSGTPFGRTGAKRIVDRRPLGPYRHVYYRPHRRYYWRGYRPSWWYHRPWYWRWWHSPWWTGWWYRPWYYSPALLLGFLILIILVAFIFIPIITVVALIPAGESGFKSTINYRSTETLYFDEYWYEYEKLKAGDTITFSVQSSGSLITFAIWDQPFENLPRITESGREEYSLELEMNHYVYYSFFLRGGSIIR
ncbi:MAG: hypothetical protein ACTSU4_00495, partial [Promethearchaeota archaeon]